MAVITGNSAQPAVIMSPKPVDKPMTQFVDFWAQRYATQGQYFFTRWISQRIGAVLAYLALRVGLTPNAVTVMGLGVMLGASACLALSPGREALLVAALLLYQLGFGFDCADGQLARATGRTSAFGAWLDVAADHVRQMGVLFALGLVLLQQSEVPRLMALGALFVLGSGSAVSLHTATQLKGGDFRPHGLTGAGAVIKRVIKEIGDTPLLLLLICVLQGVPWLLCAYLVLVGGLYLAQALAQAMLRIRPGMPG